ncbi:MAG: hypothetical protein HFI58_06210 [Lachnospiraceae bacterium]|jgi:hypothetical protein|nr:hypothetical protein [Lachnospiraceae bacterium]MCI9254417.1 hypothetical protein [Lachnospiraceae bacterium]
MKRSILSPALLVLTVLAVILSVWGPEALATYTDRRILNQIKTQEEETGGEGYRYRLSSNEKLYILSRCLNAQTLPETEQSARTRETEPDSAYRELTGTYAFVVNHNGPSGKEITDEQIYETANREISILKEAGILPEEIREIRAQAYEATLYSAIDVPEPRNNVAVWKLSLTGSLQNANKENRLIDAYIDADDGKIYEFYVRAQLGWEDIDPDALIDAWSSYMGLTKPEAYETDNPLLETTPYYKKYVFAGSGEERTIVTVGFYEGINELFLKISR